MVNASWYSSLPVICKVSYLKKTNFLCNEQLRGYGFFRENIDGVNRMDRGEKKKVLFVSKMGNRFARLIDKRTDFNQANYFFLQSYESLITPFGDLMRDIILTVYQENVEEIVVVGANEGQRDAKKAISMIKENKQLQENLQTLNYLFENCNPEFSEVHIEQWLRGSSSATDCVQGSIDVIRKHPLMPPHVKVSGLFLDSENENLSESRNQFKMPKNVFENSKS